MPLKIWLLGGLGGGYAVPAPRTPRVTTPCGSNSRCSPQTTKSTLYVRNITVFLCSSSTLEL